MDGVTLPTDADPSPDPDPRGACCAAVVLAAGMSRRMGRAKLLLPFAGTTLIAHVVHLVMAARDVEPVLVVTGAGEGEVRAALEGYDVRYVHNPGFASGEMLSSIKAGVRALPADAAGFFLVLGDQPMVRPTTLSAMRKTFVQRRPMAVLPTHRGKRGHPVLVSAEARHPLLDLPDDATLKTFLGRFETGILELPVDDPAVRSDVDTPEDYDRAVALWSATNGGGGACGISEDRAGRGGLSPFTGLPIDRSVSWQHATQGKPPRPKPKDGGA